jgi:hypothetical protein
MYACKGSLKSVKKIKNVSINISKDESVLEKI